MPTTRSRSSSPPSGSAHEDSKRRRTHSHRTDNSHHHDRSDSHRKDDDSRRSTKDTRTSKVDSGRTTSISRQAHGREEDRRHDRRPRSSSREREASRESKDYLRDRETDRNRSDKDRRRNDDHSNRDRRRSRSRDRERWSKRRSKSPEERKVRDDRSDRRRSDYRSERNFPSTNDSPKSTDLRSSKTEISIKGAARSTAATAGSNLTQSVSQEHSPTAPVHQPLSGVSLSPGISSSKPKELIDPSAPGSAVAKARAIAEAREGRLPGESLEQQKLRMKRERLEQWKAKKALEEGNSIPLPSPLPFQSTSIAPVTPVATPATAGDKSTAAVTSAKIGPTIHATGKSLPKRPTALAADEATAAALAAAAISARLGAPLPMLQPANLSRNAAPVGIKGLPAKPSFNPFPEVLPNGYAKIGAALATEEDGNQKKIQKLTFEAINADDDLLKLVEAEEDSDEEDLVDGGHGGYNIRKLVGNVQDEEGADVDANSDNANEAPEDSANTARLSQAVEEATKKRFEAVSLSVSAAKGATSSSNVPNQSAMDIEEEDIDPLDAYMSGVTDEVSKVNASDRQRMSQLNQGRKVLEEEVEEEEEEVVVGSDDEIEKTNLRPEDILAYVKMHS